MGRPARLADTRVRGRHSPYASGWFLEAAILVLQHDKEGEGGLRLWLPHTRWSELLNVSLSLVSSSAEVSWTKMVFFSVVSLPSSHACTPIV
jgi:hypothetical protein